MSLPFASALGMRSSSYRCAKFSAASRRDRQQAIGTADRRPWCRGPTAMASVPQARGQISSLDWPRSMVCRPPPAGVSSTERCLSCAKSRIWETDNRQISSLSARPASDRSGHEHRGAEPPWWEDGPQDEALSCRWCGPGSEVAMSSGPFVYPGGHASGAAVLVVDGTFKGMPGKVVSPDEAVALRDQFGGQASISAHGLIMTTAPFPIPDLAGGGAWNFNAAPPTASIINYGQINMSRGGSAFLIAHDIENHGNITAPQGDIGLYAGKQVLISDRPYGRGLSAQSRFSC